MACEFTALFAIVGYGACSSLMLIVNKLAVHHLPAPSFVLLCQFVASWLAVKLAGLANLITVDKLETSKFRAFLPVSAAFLACVFANMKTLQYGNVETFIVFRASTPIAISVAEWLFLGRELPNARSTICLLVLVFSAIGYTLSDSHFEVRGYSWVAGWYAIFCFDQLYIKYAVDKVEVESNWGRVFYTNLWASVLAGTLSAATEPRTLHHYRWTDSSMIALSVSCVLGVSMSYFAFLCRAQVSATCFTVIGNACKIITVFINVMIWDKHASTQGMACLGVALVAAFFYQQSPKRSVPDPDMEEAPLQHAVAT